MNKSSAMGYLDLGRKRIAFVEQVLQEVLLLSHEIVNEMEPHAGLALECNVLLLHDDGGLQPAESKAVGDDPGIETVGLVQIRVRLSKLADELWVNGEDFSLSLL